MSIGSPVHRPSIDTTRTAPALDAHSTCYCCYTVQCSLGFITELGCVDVLHEVSLLSQYQAPPRQEQMEQALHIIAFLNKYPKLILYMNPGLTDFDYLIFTTDATTFKEHYRGTSEEMPYMMPRPRGVLVRTTAFVDSSHGANKMT